MLTFEKRTNNYTGKPFYAVLTGQEFIGYIDRYPPGWRFDHCDEPDEDYVYGSALSADELAEIVTFMRTLEV